MRVYFEIEQGSLDWHLLRHGKIGGTASAQLFVNSDTLFYDLLAEQTERYDEDADSGYVSEAMERGKELEPQARAELSAYLGVELLECGWIQSDNELLGISPDGISPDLTVQCEIKCPQAKKHLRNCVEDVIPLDNINQCIHAFAVNPRLERLVFLSYRPESPKAMFVKELKRTDTVNIGTKARPVNKTVAECVEIIHERATELNEKLKEAINNLNF
jgi:hypothetical protein